MWLGLAVAVVLGAVALAAAETAWASSVLALVGVPLAAYASIAAPARVGVTLGVMLLVSSLGVLAYWVYVILDALVGAS